MRKNESSATRKWATKLSSQRAILRLVGLVAGVMLGWTPVEAATITAASCNNTGGQLHVQAAVNAAANGDTVVLPAGTCTWTTPVQVQKGLTIQGQGIGQTKILDARARPDAGAGTLLDVVIPQGTNFRLTGIEWRGDGTQGRAADGTIVLSGCSITTANYRIDHNKFNQLNNNAIRTHGNLYGVIDHNDGLPGYGGAHMVNSNNETYPRDGVNCSGAYGDGVWEAPLSTGSIKAHYVEDNTWFGYYNTSASSIVDSNCGSSMVVRYNTLTSSGIGSHGTDSGGRCRSQRWLEIYNNTFLHDPNEPVDSVGWFRGGSGVAFNNAITVNRQAGFNNYFKYTNLRSDDPGQRTFAPWKNSTGQFPDCNGTTPWDRNTGDSSGAGYRCLDQPGSGTSAYLQSVDPPPAIKANNALEPIYIWNNTVNGQPDNCGNFGCNSDGVVKVGRDVFIGQARPGYTAFTYPHPLVGAVGAASAAPPAAPSGMRVQ